MHSVKKNLVTWQLLLSADGSFQYTWMSCTQKWNTNNINKAIFKLFTSLAKLVHNIIFHLKLCLWNTLLHVKVCVFDIYMHIINFCCISYFSVKPSHGFFKHWSKDSDNTLLYLVKTYINPRSWWCLVVFAYILNYKEQIINYLHDLGVISYRQNHCRKFASSSNIYYM